jgi:hypothetical protein
MQIVWHPACRAQETAQKNKAQLAYKGKDAQLLQ